MNTLRLIITILLGVALACLAGVLNGMYTMGMMANSGEVIAASAIGCTVLAAILMFMDWHKTYPR